MDINNLGQVVGLWFNPASGVNEGFYAQPAALKVAGK
jgi:hypothetical protein